jgi:RHS repeat-associated protein
MATVSDSRTQHASSAAVDYYQSEIVTASDYAPFGIALVDRKYNSGRYRYGFNGKENDFEITAEGNQQDYGLRIYDPRLGRFLSVDPLFKEYAWNSTYAFAENDVLRNVDLDGAEKYSYLYLPQWAKNTVQVLEGAGEGLKQLGHDLAPIRLADENDPQTLSEAWQRIKSIPENLKNLPSSIRKTFSEGSLKEKVQVTVGIVGTIAALKSGKVSSPQTALSVVKAGFVSSKITTALKFLTKEPIGNIPFGCENIAEKVQKTIGGQFLQITPKIGNQIGLVNGEASRWYHHVAVVKDNFVFDKLTGAAGMPLTKYKEMFDYADDLDFEVVNKITVK